MSSRYGYDKDYRREQDDRGGSHRGQDSGTSARDYASRDSYSSRNHHNSSSGGRSSQGGYSSSRDSSNKGDDGRYDSRDRDRDRYGGAERRSDGSHRRDEDDNAYSSRSQDAAAPHLDASAAWDPVKEAENDANWARIYVSNLPSDITSDELQELFGGLGVIAREKQKRGFKDQWVVNALLHVCYRCR